MKLHEARPSFAIAIITTTRGIYPKISLLPVVQSQINTIPSFIKVKISSDFQTRFHDEYALPTPARHAVKVENRSGLTLLCIGRRLTHQLSSGWFVSMSIVFLLLLKSCVRYIIKQ